MRKLLVTLSALVALMFAAPSAMAHQPDLDANWEKAHSMADTDCGKGITIFCSTFGIHYRGGVFFGSHSRAYLFEYREDSGGIHLFQHRDCTTRVRMNLHYSNDPTAGVYQWKKKCGGWYSGS